MAFSFIILCLFVRLSNIAAEEYVELKNFINEDSSLTCLEVCEYNGYECYDNVVQDMECPYAAMDVCGLSSIKDATHYWQCDKGGCYVDCSTGVYADRGEGYLTCYSNPICHSTDPDGATSFSQVCPCAIISTTPSEPLHIYLWEMIGMGSLLLFFVVGGVAALHYFFPGLFPSRYLFILGLVIFKGTDSLLLYLQGKRGCQCGHGQR
jgi:hypothetical protein